MSSRQILSLQQQDDACRRRVAWEIDQRTGKTQFASLLAELGGADAAANEAGSSTTAGDKPDATIPVAVPGYQEAEPSPEKPMTTATARATHPYLGLGSAAALKKHVLQKNHKLVGRDTVALVREPGDTEGRTYYLLARRASGDMLYLVLPDSKQLCYARVRQERQDMPFLFEVLA